MGAIICILPAYRMAMTELWRRKEAHAHDLALAAHLATVLGVTIRHHNDDHSRATHLWHNAIGPLRVEHGQLHVERGFFLNESQAEAFCALVSRWSPTTDSQQ